MVEGVAHRWDDTISVLAVDDDPNLLALGKRYLERDHRMTVTTASSGAEGLERLHGEYYDCVVSDYRMPEMDGLAFLERVRTELDRSLPFIVFTGNSREEVAIDALNLGANRYVQKGADTAAFGVLADAIEQEVDHRRKTLLKTEYEERLELAQEIADFGIIDWDLRTDRVYCSAELRRMFGLPVDESLTMADIEAVMHPDDAARIQAAIESAIERGEDYRLSHRIQRPDGRVIWTKNQATLKYDDDGNPVRMLGIAVDVTAERQAKPVEAERD